jgi:hypothetical protein
VHRRQQLRLPDPGWTADSDYRPAACMRLLEQGAQPRQLGIPLEQQRYRLGDSHHAADRNHAALIC